MLLGISMTKTEIDLCWQGGVIGFGMSEKNRAEFARHNVTGTDFHVMNILPVWKTHKEKKGIPCMFFDVYAISSFLQTTWRNSSFCIPLCKWCLSWHDAADHAMLYPTFPTSARWKVCEICLCFLVSPFPHFISQCCASSFSGVIWVHCVYHKNCAANQERTAVFVMIIGNFYCRQQCDRGEGRANPV